MAPDGGDPMTGRGSQSSADVDVAAERGSARWADVDAAIEASAESAFTFLERLVADPSTVGAERGAQDVVAAELARLGFAVTELPVPDEIADHAPAGVAQGSYADRPNV